MLKTLIAVLTIALVSALSFIYSTCLHYEVQAAEQVQAQVRSALPTLERAYAALTNQQQGIPPKATLDSDDGGFASQFLPFIHFSPPAPAGFEWRYGLNEVPGSPYFGFNYFCLYPFSSNYERSVSIGFKDSMAYFPKSQIVLNAACGADSNTDVTHPDWGDTPAALTFYVVNRPSLFDDSLVRPQK